jgi:hypothetical protein
MNLVTWHTAGEWLTPLNMKTFAVPCPFSPRSTTLTIGTLQAFEVFLTRS